MSADALVSRLAGVRRTGPGRWLARCPSHDDRNPSLAIAEKEDGRTLIYCHALCAVDDIVAAVGMTLADLMPPRAIGHHIRRKRSPLNAHDVLAALEAELTIASVAALDLGKGRILSEADRERLLLASRRIRAAIDSAVRDD